MWQRTFARDWLSHHAVATILFLSFFLYLIPLHSLKYHSQRLNRRNQPEAIKQSLSKYSFLAMLSVFITDLSTSCCGSTLAVSAIASRTLFGTSKKDVRCFRPGVVRFGFNIYFDAVPDIKCHQRPKVTQAQHRIHSDFR